MHSCKNRENTEQKQREKYRTEKRETYTEYGKRGKFLE